MRFKSLIESKLRCRRLQKDRTLLQMNAAKSSALIKRRTGTLVPYRVYFQRAMTATSTRPLVVMLHGALGDERYYFSDLFDPAVVKGEAERRGYILAGVNGRARFSSYAGPSQEDTFEVINAVTRDYKIDPTKIYLTGHSMGGFGVWLIASDKPDLFAAIAPVSSGAPVRGNDLNAFLRK